MNRIEIIIELLKAYRAMGANLVQVIFEAIKLTFASDRYLIEEAYLILNSDDME